MRSRLALDEPVGSACFFSNPRRNQRLASRSLLDVGKAKPVLAIPRVAVVVLGGLSIRGAISLSGKRKLILPRWSTP